MRQDKMGFGMQWHQLYHMQTIYTSLQTDNHTNTPSLNFYRPGALFLRPDQQRQSTEGNNKCNCYNNVMHNTLRWSFSTVIFYFAHNNLMHVYFSEHSLQSTHVKWKEFLHLINNEWLEWRYNDSDSWCYKCGQLVTQRLSSTFTY